MMIYLLSLAYKRWWYILPGRWIKRSSLCRFTCVKGHIFTCNIHLVLENKITQSASVT